MIRLNLLPRYIIERRRVKAVVIGLVALLILEVLALGAYVWAPAPFPSLKHKLAVAKADSDAAWEEWNAVEQLKADIAAAQARYAVKAAWVGWVEAADGVPEAWVTYLGAIRETIPADVVIHGLQLPSGGRLNLSGSTSDMMAGVRWYLNMLRSEIVQPDPNAVVFNPGTGAVVGPGTAADPMRLSVGMSVALRQEVMDVLMMVPAPPGGAAAGGARASRGGGRASAGGGRMGGGGGMRGGMRGGRGGMGGGRRGGMGGGRRGGGGGGPRGGRWG